MDVDDRETAVVSPAITRVNSMDMDIDTPPRVSPGPDSPRVPVEAATPPSRDATPISTVSSSHETHVPSLGAQHGTEHDGATSSSSSGASVGPTSAASAASIASPGIPVAVISTEMEDNGPEDIDRFLRRVEMEKKLVQLQQRLELASFKTNHGWTDIAPGEIENRPPPSPSRAHRRPPLALPSDSSSTPTYEPPSPSRPWQLADVLWQPLPQPSGSPHFASPRPAVPSSPRKRRMDDHLDSLPPGLPFSPLRTGASVGTIGSPHPNPPPKSPSKSSGHRRASSSIGSLQFLTTDPHPSSPLRPKKGAKKRSQSHSVHARDRPSTQDVDAAKALTFMLGSGRTPSMSDGIPSSLRHAPLLSTHGSASLPSPLSPESPPFRPRAQSFAVPENHAYPQPPGVRSDFRRPSIHTRGGSSGSGSSGRTVSRTRERRSIERDKEEGMAGRAEEDKTAVELMMFLAHSPSPLTNKRTTDTSAGFGSAARVLFADSEGPPGGGSGTIGSVGTNTRPAHPSNLVSAPPITSQSSESLLGAQI